MDLVGRPVLRSAGEIVGRAESGFSDLALIVDGIISTHGPQGGCRGSGRTADPRWPLIGVTGPGPGSVECYQSLGSVLEAYGVQVAIEPLNRFETYFLNTTADALALCDEINHSNVGILFDTFHANIAEKGIGAACRTAGRRLKHVHSCENDRRIPGSGHVEWQEFFQALRNLNYDDWLTIESFGFALGELEGVKFLKRNVKSLSAQ
jgi:sugar phosphate isomerase/epimerase